MKIAIIGYGKMGKAIEEIAISKGHEIVLKINSQNIEEFTKENLQKADVCIEFTTPHTAFENVQKCLQAGVPTICGSTAWLEKLDEAKLIAIDNNTAFLYASNFSIGVNLFFKINKMVAAIMQKHPEYQVSMEEIHHTHKKDAPSGTAVTLAEGVLENYTSKNKWVNEATTQENELSIISKRIDPAPGTHTIFYQSEIDEISINHTAHSRIGFASGSVLAAEFLHTKKGIFTMNDVLSL
jgi:4-hydroxy-tetrahydrodipicolinate reductase